ncbi:MAG TPA: Ig-like domain-containing protein, partial [Bryobacteraceae bacterium]|nr:Ig-like domain-containing protein [Bryobacteraceae bacterium]
MNRLRAICMATLLGGLAGLAPAQTLTLRTDPVSPITYGTPVTLTAFVDGIDNCGGVEVFFFDHTVDISGPIGTATAVQIAFPPRDPICEAILANSYTSALPVGTHSQLEAVYENGTTFPTGQATTLVVNQAPTTISLATVPNPSTVGHTVTLTATVSPAGATGTVTFLDGATKLTSASVSGGVASVGTTALKPGKHSLTASYSGDSNYLGSVSTAVNQTVNQIVTVTSLQVVPTVGQTVALTATVAPSTATGTVTFLDGSTTLFTAPLNAGTANSTATLSVGSHSLTASYGGDTNDAPSVSSPVAATVNQIVTTTTLQAVPTSSNTGQTVALTAAVSPSTATGNVTFQDGATTIGIAPLSAGTANFSISTLATGRHSLTASYGGDTNDAPSVSSPVIESVALLTTATALAAAPNPSVAGQSVTLTATVTPGNPTGTVSFFDGANLLGSGALSNGVATVATSSLTAANHSLTASYGGDANNAPSTSPAVTQLVNPGSTGTGAPNPIAVSPASGSGSSEVMSFTFNDPRGWQDLDIVNVLIGNFLDGRNACYLAYSRSAGVLYLVADNGGTLSSGLALGGSGSVSNSQCTVAGAASS